MSSVPVAPEHTALWDLESDLPSLASQAAIELDNLLLGRNDNLEAVQRLASEISKLVTSVSEPASPTSLLNPATATVLNRAIAESMPMGPLHTKLSKLDELVDAASRVTERLDKVLENPKDIGAEELRHMRMFCLALSRSAWASERSPYDKRPEHPFRR